MSSKLEQMMMEILDKKFSVGLHSGYDPEDVDQFFDYVISYLTNVNIQIGSLNEERNNLLLEIKTLNDQVNKKHQHIDLLQKELDDLKREGYGNQRLIDEVRQIREKQETQEKQLKNK